MDEMKWYLNINDEKIIGAYAEKLIDNLIEYEADENFDRTQYKYSDGQVLKISEQERMTLYSEEIAIKQERTLADMMTASARTSFLIELPDAEAVKIPLCYDSWETDKAYKVGDRVMANYGNVDRRILHKKIGNLPLLHKKIGNLPLRQLVCGK